MVKFHEPLKFISHQTYLSIVGVTNSNFLSLLPVCLRMTNEVSGRRIVILLELDIVQQRDAAIGNPVNIEQQATENTALAAKPEREAAPAVQSRGAPSYMQRNSAAATGPSAFSAAISSNQFHPIASLNPYQNRWVIKVRVTSKSEIRTWQNKNGEGKLFSIDLLDAQGGKIRATMFKDAVDKFYNIFQQDKVYIISKGVLKIANKKFTHIPNEYELTLNSDAEVQYVGEDESIQTKFEFKNLEEIRQTEPNAFIDIIAVVTQVNPVGKIMTKNNKELTKRTVQVTDRTCLSIELTFWGEQAEEYNEVKLSNNPVIIVKNCRVSDFGGRTLSTTFQSQIFVNPDRAEAHELKAWFDHDGKNANLESLSNKKMGGEGGGSGMANRKSFASVKDEQLGFHDKPDFFSVRGVITFIKQEYDKPPYYKACPGHKDDGKECQRKVTDEGNGQYFCAGCNKSFTTFTPRYVLSLLACDSTGANWLSAFNDEASKLLNISALNLSQIKDTGNEQQYKQIFTDAQFKQYLFKIRAAADKNGDEVRVRCHIVSAAPIDYKQESNLLLQEIAKYN
jgi:replication factor A1